MVCAVDEVVGLHRYQPETLLDVPTTVARGATCSESVLTWNGQAVGLLDVDRLYAGVKRGVA
jgi:chemotaxis signal transduction protein